MVAHVADQYRKAGHEVTLYTFWYSADDCYPEILKQFTVVEADADCVARIKRTSSTRGVVAFFKTYISENSAARNLALKISKDTTVLNPHDQLAYRVIRYFKREVKNVPSVWMMNDISTKRASLKRNAQFNPNLRVSFVRKVWYWLLDTFEYFWFIRYQDKIAVVDTRDRDMADQQFYKKNTYIVRNGLDVTEFPYQAREGINGTIYLLCVAILLPHRRFEDAIMAVSLLNKKGIPTELTIIGAPADMDYYRALQALVTELEIIDKVHFFGKVPYEQLREAYRTSHIFVFPCHLQSWGLVVFEAIASGLPVIVSKTAGASEVLEDKKTAMIVNPYSPEQIVAAVEELAHDPALYRNISKDGRKFVEENISWERYARELLDLCKEAGA